MAPRRFRSARIAGLAGLACLAAACTAPPAVAREGLDLAAEYTADIGATVAGAEDGRVRYLDNLELSLGADLGKLAGIDDTSVFLTVLNNMGARPNDDAGSLQGIDNIEVGRAALRLFEAWAEHRFGPSSLRLGLYDLNSEFYATESAALLISPPFGIGSELAGSGPAGPSIFPSSALAARLRTTLGLPDSYAQVAVLNARAQTFGDPGSVDLTFGDGLMVIGEVGAGEALRWSLGAWTYTKPRDAMTSGMLPTAPDPERPAGLYAMVEGHLIDGERRKVRGFLRGGIARGRTQPFVNSAQAGLLIEPAIVGRENSAFSIGVNQAETSGEFRAAQIAAGDPPWRREWAIEATYSDVVMPHVTLQPDIQVIGQSGEGLPGTTAVQLTLRMQVSY